LILAHERELWWGDWYLRERARLDPGPQVLCLAIAARSDGCCWMLTEREGRTELWQLVVGRCVLALAISEQLVDARLLVAPDDSAVLVGSREVACFDAEGALRWTFPRSGAAVGLIDPQAVALYSDGGALICTDAHGNRATVWMAPSGIDRLGPIGGTGSQLCSAHRLRPEPGALPAMLWVGAGRVVFGLR
jgi:hypothetical protein